MGISGLVGNCGLEGYSHRLSPSPNHSSTSFCACSRRMSFHLSIDVDFSGQKNTQSPCFERLRPRSFSSRLQGMTWSVQRICVLWVLLRDLSRVRLKASACLRYLSTASASQSRPTPAVYLEGTEKRQNRDMLLSVPLRNYCMGVENKGLL